MELIRLKQDLSKFGGDFNDFETIVEYIDLNGKKNYSLCSFVGWCPEFNCIMLGTQEAAQKRVDEDNIDLDKFRK